MKKIIYCIVLFLLFALLILSGYSQSRVPNQYDLKLKTKEKSLSVFSQQNSTVNITIDSRRYHEIVSEQNIFLSYHILDINNKELLHDGLRTSLEMIPARGIQKEVVNFIAPKEPGKYILEIDLVEEGVTWFSEQGMPTLKILLEVVE